MKTAAAHWQDAYIERPDETARLQAAWALAKSGAPQLVAVVAEQGFGKTRLVQRFFETLSISEDRAGPEGWWPDTLNAENSIDAVTPALRAAATGTMPFLWWGIRLRDPGEAEIRYATELSSARETLRHYLRQELVQQARARGTRDIVQKLALDIALDQAANAANIATFGFGGVIKSTAEAGKQYYDLQHGKLDATPDHVSDIITDLRAVCAAPSGDRRPVPMCLFIDDFQFLSADLEACRLLDEIARVARDEHWPLLILVTSWDRGWHGEVNQTRITGWSLPTTMVELAPMDLARLVDMALPGLTPPQIALLLERAEGNPRSLKYLLANLTEDHRYLFEGRDTARPLTPDGEAYVREQTHDKVVAERFARSPDDVKTLLATASIQGVGFAPPLALRTCANLNLPANQQHLLKAERPYAFITMRGPDAAEFRQNNVWRAASNWLPNVGDPEAVRIAYQAAIGALAKDAEAGESADERDEILAQTQLASDDPWKREDGRRAIRRMFQRATERREFAVQAALAERWLKSIDRNNLADIRHAFDGRSTLVGPLVALLVQGPLREDLQYTLRRAYNLVWPLYTAIEIDRTAIELLLETEDLRTVIAIRGICECIAIFGTQLFDRRERLFHAETGLMINERMLSSGLISIAPRADASDNSFVEHNTRALFGLHACIASCSDDLEKVARSTAEMARLAPLIGAMAAMGQADVDRAASIVSFMPELRVVRRDQGKRAAEILLLDKLSALDAEITRNPAPAALAMKGWLIADSLRIVYGAWLRPRRAKKLAVHALETLIRAHQAGHPIAEIAGAMADTAFTAGRQVRHSKPVRQFAERLRNDIRNFDDFVAAATGTSAPPFVPREIVTTHAALCVASATIQFGIGEYENGDSDFSLGIDNVSKRLDVSDNSLDAIIAGALASRAYIMSIIHLKFAYVIKYYKIQKRHLSRVDEIHAQYGLSADLFDLAKGNAENLYALDARGSGDNDGGAAPAKAP